MPHGRYYSARRKMSEATWSSYWGKERSALRLWGNIGAKLDANVADCRKHISQLRCLIKQKDEWALNAWLHHDLTVLDDKTNTILQVTSIGIASLTFYLGSKNVHSSCSLWFTLASFVLLFFSLMFLLRIPYVHWSSTHDFAHHNDMFCE